MNIYQNLSVGSGSYIKSKICLHEASFSFPTYNRLSRLNFSFFRTYKIALLLGVLYEVTKLPTDETSHSRNMETSPTPLRTPQNSHK